MKRKAATEPAGVYRLRETFLRSQFYNSTSIRSANEKTGGCPGTPVVPNPPVARCLESGIWDRITAGAAAHEFMTDA